jgi:hypothetical protein
MFRLASGSLAAVVTVIVSTSPAATDALCVVSLQVVPVPMVQVIPVLLPFFRIVITPSLPFLAAALALACRFLIVPAFTAGIPPAAVVVVQVVALPPKPGM